MIMVDFEEFTRLESQKEALSLAQAKIIEPLRDQVEDAVNEFNAAHQGKISIRNFGDEYNGTSTPAARITVLDVRIGRMALPAHSLDEADEVIATIEDGLKAMIEKRFDNPGIEVYVALDTRFERE